MLLSTRLQCGIGVPEVQHIVPEKAVQEFLVTKVIFAFLDSVLRIQELFQTMNFFTALHALVGNVTFCAKIWRILTHLLAKAYFQSIFARSASAVTPSKKAQLTLIVSHYALLSLR